ncbi:MAG: hypothetical protein JWO90_2348 [Solirubrobacterales bacterium]|nr:hypothetical protein [Solirubrobacterales bacterium]
MSTRAANEDGFTLIELLVAMVLSLIVLFAVLTAFDVFSSNAAQQTHATAANERARATMDRTVDDLRHAATIRTASPTDLVYSVTEATGTRTQRLCVGADAVLYSSTSTSATTTGTACGTTESGWTQGKVADLPAGTTTAFTFDGAATSATPATVRSVGITLDVDAGRGGRTASSTLRASATVRRSAGQLAVGDGDIRADCNTSGALLTLDVAGIGAAGPLNVTYTSTGGVQLGVGNGDSPVQISAGITGVLATITDAAGVTNTVQKVVECS